MQDENLSNQEKMPQEAAESLEQVERDKEGSEGKRLWEFPQSITAIYIAIGIIFLMDILNIVLALLPGEILDESYLNSPFGIAFGTIFDVFLCIKILQGRNWARKFMLFRLAAGVLLFGGIALAQGNYGELTITVGISLTLILLLTGTSTRFRIVGSLVLGALATLGGFIVVVAMTFTTDLPTVPETPTPDNFLTYTSEGFFSISYPPDWEPNMSIIEEVEADMKQWAKSEGFESQTDEMQLVFGAVKMTIDENSPGTNVMVVPRGIWPLDVLFEADRQQTKNMVEQYDEHSVVKTTIGGREAIIFAWQGVLPGDFESPLLRFTTAYIAGSEFIWVVTCVSDSQDSDAYLNTFNDIVRSLRVEY